MCYSVAAVIGQPHKNEPSPHPSSSGATLIAGDHDSLLVTCRKPGSQYDVGAASVMSVVHVTGKNYFFLLVKLHPCC